MIDDDGGHDCIDDNDAISSNDSAPDSTNPDTDTFIGDIPGFAVVAVGIFEARSLTVPPPHRLGPGEFVGTSIVASGKKLD